MVGGCGMMRVTWILSVLKVLCPRREVWEGSEMYAMVGGCGMMRVAYTLAVLEVFYLSVYFSVYLSLFLHE